jgi:hypothetical protein
MCERWFGVKSGKILKNPFSAAAAATIVFFFGKPVA